MLPDGKTELCLLAEKYGTDKNIWGYTPFYYEAFRNRREAVTKVFELGICGQRDIPNNVTGASLFMWRDFFPNATVVGVDNDPKWMVTGADRIVTYLADETRPDTMVAPLSAHGPYDLIVDDAIHDPMPQLVALETMIPSLHNGGVYAMEDVCPYKMPNGDLTSFVDAMPKGLDVRVIRTHKPEVLLLITRRADREDARLIAD